MNWDAFWQAWIALAGTALVIVTVILVIVGVRAADWARRTFGQTEQIEGRRRNPLIALSIAAPAAPEEYLRFAQLDQIPTWAKWFSSITKGPLANVVKSRSILTCFAYNIGEGPALRIRVPYRLTVFDVTRVGSDAETDAVEGEFEIVHVAPNQWGAAKTYLDVSYYPKYKVELMLDKARITGVDGPVKQALTETTEPVKEGNNHATWELLRQFPSPSPPPSAPPGSTPRLG